MQINIDDVERILLRSIIERKETCRQAAEQIMAYIRRLEAERLQERDPSV